MGPLNRCAILYNAAAAASAKKILKIRKAAYTLHNLSKSGEAASYKILACQDFIMAGGPGFEPGLTGPEPVVLPLNDPPAKAKI